MIIKQAKSCSACANGHQEAYETCGHCAKHKVYICDMPVSVCDCYEPAEWVLKNFNDIGKSTDELRD